MPRKKSVATKEKEPEEELTPIEDLFEVDDICWVKMKGYPWWPGRVYNEKGNVPEKVAHAKKANSVLVHFLESDLFQWANRSEIQKFKGDNYAELSKREKKSKGWLEAFDLCTKFAKGTYTPHEVEVDELPAKSTGKRKNSSAATPTSKRKKTEDKKSTPKKETTTGKRRRSRSPATPRKKANTTKSTSTKEKSAPKTSTKKTTEKAPASPRKPGRPASTKSVPLKKGAVEEISKRLKSQIDEDSIKGITEELNILSKIEFADPDTLKSVPLLDQVKELKNNSDSKVKKLAGTVFTRLSKLDKEAAKSVDKKTTKKAPVASTSKKPVSKNSKSSTDAEKKTTKKGGKGKSTKEAEEPTEDKTEESTVAKDNDETSVEQSAAEPSESNAE